MPVRPRASVQARASGWQPPRAAVGCSFHRQSGCQMLGEVMNQGPESEDARTGLRPQRLLGPELPVCRTSQRLAIARALITDPWLLILDEATSALDLKARRIIRQNLRRIASGRTVIIVSHRLSMLADAEAILALDRGRTSDIGRHEQRLARCASYRQLWSRQTGQAA